MDRVCRRCGAKFEGKGNQWYCGDVCRETVLKEQKARYQRNYHRRLKEDGGIKRECKCCKKIFTPVRAQKYCDECRTSVGIPSSVIKEKKQMEKPKMSLVDVAKAAKAAGMTYGEYVVKMEAAG